MGLRGTRLLLLLLIAPVASAWASGIHPGTAARVNGVEVSYERFNAFYQEYRRPHGISVAGRGDHLNRLTKLRKEAMDEMIKQELVFQSEGFTQESYREHVKRMIAAKKYLDDIRLGVDAVSDEELEQYYRDNEYRLTFPEQVRVRHILLTWKPMGTTDDRGAIRKQMEPILERARAGEDFAELAGELSDDYATKRSGGDTGLFKRGEMAPAFEAAAFALEPGEISDPVETPFGVHILKLEERREAYLLPLDEIREDLRDHVREERMETAVEAEIERLRTEGEVEILIALERPKDR